MTTMTEQTALTVVDQEDSSPRPLATSSTSVMTPDVWAMLKEQAITLEIAGQGTGILPKGITNRAQIAAILMKGRELGLAPMYSLEQIGLVNGRPVVQSQALMAIIQHAHGPNAIAKIESTNERAEYEFSRKGADPKRFAFTIQDAATADLKGKSGPWKQYPRVMLKWRCIAEGAREYFADTIAGLYLPDEMGLPVAITSSGDMVIEEHAPEPESAYRADLPHASPYKAASANQLATVSKLSRLLGRPEDIGPDMTSAEASERITDLSREYNERKGSPTPRGNRATSEPQSQGTPAAAEQPEQWQVGTRRAVAGALSVSREGSEQEKAFTTDVRQYMTRHYSTMNISRLSDEQLAQLVRDKFPSLIDGLPAELRGKPAGQRYTPGQLENMPDAAKQEAARAQEQIEAGIAAGATVPADDSVSF